jgi:hypothetical protein
MINLYMSVTEVVEVEVVEVVWYNAAIVSKMNVDTDWWKKEQVRYQPICAAP